MIEIASAQDSYLLGEALALTAVRHGAASALPTTWLKACDPELEEPWTVIAEGEALSVSTENCSYRAEIVSTDGERLSASQDFRPNIQFP